MDERREVPASGGRRSGGSRPRIVEGARASFLERGYVGTTMEGIAERAGVAVQTVYYVFGTKHSVLAAVLDASIVGDHDAVPLAGRDWMGDLTAIADSDEAFTRMLDACVDILDRTTPIYDVVCHGVVRPRRPSALRRDPTAPPCRPADPRGGAAPPRTPAVRPRPGRGRRHLLRAGERGDVLHAHRRLRVDSRSVPAVARADGSSRDGQQPAVGRALSIWAWPTRPHGAGWTSVSDDA